MTSPEYPAQDVDDDDQPGGPQQPIPTQRHLRILAVPELPKRYIPEEGDPDLNAVIVLNYNMFMSAVRELAGSQMTAFRLYGAKLEESVVQDAAEHFASQLQAQYALGVEDAKAWLRQDHDEPDETAEVDEFHAVDRPQASQQRFQGF